MYLWGTWELEILPPLAILPSPKSQPPYACDGLSGSWDGITPHFPLCLFCLLHTSIINFKLPALTFKASLHFEAVFIASLIFAVSPSLAPTPSFWASLQVSPYSWNHHPHAPPSRFPPSSVKLSLISLISPLKNFEGTLLWHNKQMDI